MPLMPLITLTRAMLAFDADIFLPRRRHSAAHIFIDYCCDHLFSLLRYADAAFFFFFFRLLRYYALLCRLMRCCRATALPRFISMPLLATCFISSYAAMSAAVIDATMSCHTLLLLLLRLRCLLILIRLRCRRSITLILRCFRHVRYCHDAAAYATC